MTEKDRTSETDVEVTEKEVAKESTDNVEIILVEEEVAEEEESTELEEKSDFLRQWEERHQAYLASQQSQANNPVEEKKSKKSDKKKSQHFPQIDSLNVETSNEKKSKKEVRPKKPIPRIALWKSVPIFVVATLLLLLSVYFISPLGKLKDIQVRGNQHVDTATIVKNSLILKEDYVLTTLLNRAGHARNIERSSRWVRDAHIDFQFPNHFTIAIEEFRQIGYVRQGEEYYSVLSSGNVAETATPTKELPTTFTTINLTDEVLIKQLVEQLTMLEPKILSSIEDIRLTPSKATNDLMTLTMTGGHEVLVPLSEIDLKMPYYPKIVQQLQVVSIIDMEVGVYSYAKE